MAMKPLLYQNDHAGSISYLVYICGMEIPSMGFDVSYGVWEIPQATVRLVPDPILHRLGAEDRVPVQCFYLDQWQYSPPEYCLMFDGEIVAWGKQHTPGGRAVTFTCADYAAILTQTFFFLMSTFDDFAVGTSGAGIGVAGNTVQTAGFGALYPYSLFAQGLANTTDVQDDRVIERPIDYAYNIVRALIKLEHENRSIPAANFFAPWVQKTNFHRRWVALPYFDADPQDPKAPGLFPVLKAVQDVEAIAAIARQAAQASNGSLWSMLQEVLRTVMCEISMLPTPAAVKSDYRTLLPRGKPTEPSGGTAPVFLTQYFVKPQSYYSLPPACNVFFPSQIQHSAYQENYATQPTRAYYNEATITNILSNVNSGAGAALMQDAMTTGYPEEVDIAVRDARDAALQNGKNMLVYPEEYFKGPVILRKQLPRWFAYLIDSSRFALEQSGTSNDTTDSGGVSGTNTASQYSRSEGGPIYFAGMANPGDAFLRNLGITSFVFPNTFNARQANGSERGAIQRASLGIRQHRPGKCTPPQRFPLYDPMAWTGYNAGRGANNDGDGRPVGGFWEIRYGGIHGGHDIGAPKGTDVVAPVSGTVFAIYSTGLRRENPLKGRPVARGRRPVGEDTLGNCVVIKDNDGGYHRLMHLYDIDAGVIKDQPITVGTKIGIVGSTGKSNWFHLHYDVIDSSGYFRMPYGYLLASLARHPNGTTAPPAQTTAPEGGTAPQSDAQNAAQNPNREAHNTSSSGSVGNVATQVHSGDTRRNVFKLYAKCDYYTERYAQRNGTISMPFNPYPIPGFGMAAFDRRDTDLDTVGYLTNVQHSVSANGWGTTISYSQGRTFQEMFALMQRDAALDAARLAQDGGDITHNIRARYDRAEHLIRELLQGHGDGHRTRAQQEQRYREDAAPGLEWISPVTGSGTEGAPEAPPPATPPADGTTDASSSTPASAPEDIDARLGGYARPAGDVRMAPAEPIEEIRKLQDPEMAAAFYRSMFWQDAEPPSSHSLNTADSDTALYEQSNQGRASFSLPDQIQSENGAYDRTSAASNLRESTEESARRSRRRSAGEREQLEARLAQPVVFRHEDIVRMVTDDDEVLNIESSGVSASASSDAMLLIRKASIKPGDMEDAEIERLAAFASGIPEDVRLDAAELRACLPRKTYNGRAISTEGQTWAYVPAPEDQMKLLKFLRAMEIYWNTQIATTNVRGDVALIPTPQAADLFESYTRAMRYNARPVCTLDEYLLFLGASDGDHTNVPENLITVYPQPSNLARNDYTHPAKYYKLIREYTMGPPSMRGSFPVNSVGNPNVAVDADVPGQPVNPAAQPPQAPPTAQVDDVLTTTTTPQSFPEAARNPEKAVQNLAKQWPSTRGQTFHEELTAVISPNGVSDERLNYRVNAILMSYLVDDGVRLQGFNPPVTRDECSTLATRVRARLLETREADGEPVVGRSVATPFLAAFARPQTFAAPLGDMYGHAAAATARVTAQLSAQHTQSVSDHEAALAAAREVVGTHTIQVQYVTGVSAQFPQTRADWFAILSKYRENVLRRLAPRG